MEVPLPSYPPPAAEGRLVLVSSYPAVMWVYPLTGPKIGIDGDRPVRAKWGSWSMAVPGGNHLVRVSVRWYSGEVAPASFEVYVPPGGEVTVHYRTPPSLSGRGAIGLTPRKARGNVVLVPVLIALIVVLYLVLSILFD